MGGEEAFAERKAEIDRGGGGMNCKSHKFTFPGNYSIVLDSLKAAVRCYHVNKVKAGRCMKKYDYVLVGSGLYAGVWAY